MAIPKLALIPATQGSKLYSVLPADGVGDFTFSRGSAATRINKDGLIETVASGVSRLNYPLIDGVVNGCPSHLLEPSRLQLIPYSEDFSNAVWEKNQSSIVANAIISPNGTLNASKLVEDSSNNFHRIIENVNTTIGTFSHSVFAKAGERKYFVLRNNINGTNTNACFDLENGVVVYNGFDEAKIENYGNGWYRCSIVEVDTSVGSTSFSLMTSNNEVTSNSIPSYQGDGTSGVYIWGAQLEQGSYATSYIPNYGTAAGITRSAETANGAGDASTFNDSEGVLMVEISALANDSYRLISLSDGTNGDNVRINFTPTANQIIFEAYSANVLQSSFTYNGTDVLLNNKIIIKYKENDYSFWVNGFKVATDTSGATPIGLDRINFDRGSGFPFYGNTKQVQYFDSALTNSELETLTSWTSFTDLANGQLYSIK